MKKGFKFSTLFSLMLILMLLTACSITNTYTELYKQNKDNSCNVENQSCDANQTLEIRKSDKIDEEYLRLLSNNYKCLGSSSFEWIKFSNKAQLKGITKQAKIIGATDVLYSCNYVRTIKSNSTTTVFNKNGTMTTTPTTPDIEKYLYKAYFFVKMTDLPLLGFMYNNISDDEKINIKRNAGIQVSIVYKDSPAYYANIVRGDIIIGINDIEIRNSDEFCELMKKFKKGDNITLTVIRQYQETKITYKL
jgi:hypothetical protein